MKWHGCRRQRVHAEWTFAGYTGSMCMQHAAVSRSGRCRANDAYWQAMQAHGQVRDRLQQAEADLGAARAEAASLTARVAVSAAEVSWCRIMPRRTATPAHSPPA